jgi:hypothetical protein
MKLDPGMHIGLHLVFFGKSGVTSGKIYDLHSMSQQLDDEEPDRADAEN